MLPKFQYNEVIRYYERIIEIYKSNDFDKRELAVFYTEVALVMYYEGKYDEALEYQRQAISIQETHLPLVHPDLAASYGTISDIYRLLGKDEEALVYCEKSLKIREGLPGTPESGLATLYGKLAVISHNLRYYETALEYHHKALKIWKADLDSGQPLLATAYSNIALTYRVLHRYRTALNYQQEALFIWETTLDRVHPALAAAYNSIALLYAGLEQHEKAEEYHQKALKIRENAYRSVQIQRNGDEPKIIREKLQNPVPAPGASEHNKKNKKQLQPQYLPDTVRHNNKNTVLKGRIYFLNSHKTPAVGVEVSGHVREMGSTNCAYTDSEGRYTLVFPRDAAGRLVNLDIGTTDSNGQAIEVVNGRELQICRIPEDPAEEFHIIVAKKGERDIIARKYYRIIKTSADEALEKLEERVNDALERQETTHKEKLAMIARVEQLRQQTDSIVIYREAYRLASINKDNASERVIKYLELLEKGESVQEAREVLSIDAAAKEMDTAT
ncbi:MAG: tetratricopeptide repeat protein, partial [Sinomicrobium sp.]|nr:tetratricopeptide repeat protein [Sinomicrobium sp.]